MKTTVIYIEDMPRFAGQSRSLDMSMEVDGVNLERIPVREISMKYREWAHVEDIVGMGVGRGGR